MAAWGLYLLLRGIELRIGFEVEWGSQSAEWPFWSPAVGFGRWSYQPPEHPGPNPLGIEHIEADEELADSWVPTLPNLLPPPHPGPTEVVPMFAPQLLGEPVPENGRLRASALDQPGFGVTLNPDVALDRPYTH